MTATERKQMSVDMPTIQIADRCAAILTLRLGEKVTRIGAVRIALGELQDKLWEAAAEAARAAEAAGEGGESHG